MDKGVAILKIALTGDSSGFGPYVREALENLGHEVIGLSRSKGYDLSTTIGRELAIYATEDCDVFINNSSAGGWQPHMLEDWLLAYYNQNKTIINISSNLALVNEPAAEHAAEWLCKNKLNDVHRKFVNGSDYHVKCQSKILSWGYWNNHPIAKDHPEVITKMTIKEAIQDIVDLL